MDPIQHPDFPAYRRLQQRMQDLADRWVRAWGEYGYRGGATDVRLSPAWGAGKHPYGEEITFYAPYVDGIGRNGSMSSKYLDDDSNLELDAKAWYDAQCSARRAAAEEEAKLRATPEVQAYLSRNQDWSTFHPFTWSR